MTLLTPASLRRTRPPRRTLITHAAAIALTFICLAAPRVAHAQQDETLLPQPEDEVVRVNADLVTVPFFVTDSKGRRVSGLALQDFEVLDDGRRVEATYFAAGAERVALLFLLDASGSARDIIAQQRETALAIFSRFGQRSRVGVMQFRERAELKLPFTNDLRAARPAFRIDSLPDRRTAIFDAALASVRVFRRAGAAPLERRIVVLISDGLDTASEADAAAVVNEARAAGVSFYVIHVPLFAPRDGRLAARRPSKGFRDLAEKTGGQFFTVGDASSSLDPRAEYDMRPIFRAIAEDLAGQYVLGYHASAAEPKAGPHRVGVRLANNRGRKLRVRQLREGYEFKNSDK